MHTIRPTQIKNHLEKFDSDFRHDKVQESDAKNQLEALHTLLRTDTSLSDLQISRAFEYEAVLFDSLGLRQQAIGSVGSSLESLPEGKKLVTDWAMWLAGQMPRQALKSERSTLNTRLKPKIKRFNIGIIAIILLLVVLMWQPVTDRLAIASATPDERTLADSLGLTAKGQAIFFKSHPEVVDSSTFYSQCPNDNTDYVEEGCTLPGSNKIYIRSMPDELKSEEIKIAAHEFLHAAYSRLSGGQKKQVNKMIETAYANISDSELTQRMALYEQSEPGLQDDELHSIIGTEYTGYNTDLANYYAEYFNDIQTEVQASQDVKNVFKGYENEIDGLNSTINQEDSQANSYYQSSSRAANDGNYYYTNYFYKLYTNEIDLENQNIAKFNSLLDRYNLLVDEFNGKDFSSKNQLTPQGGN